MSSDTTWFNPQHVVSIHVLRRGRCVGILYDLRTLPSSFQSTSSEEDVVSASVFGIFIIRRMFQSTSSEEDVVSFSQV